jgi:hypothetical protein
MFYNISDGDGIRNGVPAFWEFLRKFYGRLIAEGGPFDKPKKEAHEFSDGTSIPSSYPFLSNIEVILANMGLRGALSDDRCTLSLDAVQLFAGENKNFSNAKIPDIKKVECIRYLTDCGIRFGGLEINDKKPFLSSYGSLEIAYPDNPAMLTGLKVMASAQSKLNSTGYQDIFLRCDYRALANAEADKFLFLKDMVNPLPADVRDYVLKLHQEYAKTGYKCLLNITNLYIRYTYFCRSKELWRLNLSLNNGFSISIKATNTDKYMETVNKFPEWLREKIAGGYGCGKKMGKTVSCDGGCRGFRIPLDGSFMELSELVKTWIYKEVSCIEK